MRKLLYILLFVALAFFVSGCTTPVWVGPVRYNPPHELLNPSTERLKCRVCYHSWDPKWTCLYVDEIRWKPPEKSSAWEDPYSPGTYLAEYSHSLADLSICQADQVHDSAWSDSKRLPFADRPKGLVYVNKPPEEWDKPFRESKLSIVSVNYAVAGTTETINLAVHWRAIAPGPPVETSKPNLFAIVTYPLWGLPRDIIDAPLTFLRRIEFYRSDFDPDNPYLAMLGLGVGAWGLVEGIQWGLGVEAAFGVQLGAAILGGAVVGMAGMGIVLFGWTILSPPFADYVCPAQVATLRGGINSENYFPNWQFYALRKGDHRTPTITEHEWVIESIEQID